ncbi:hypothetical protein EIN_023790 [Entamoeba invadens IP1]|nr:hypothetical protein EIN_023790 [Entamoeba invadens IP1]ELP90680.1 hypothetical protein EIN_023790 [Entamoeba invadens IP1]|eukprot:XP_004257451.1 hypothetical protein EIN_023790 [Entamoeba invadens IP1]
MSLLYYLQPDALVNFHDCQYNAVGLTFDDAPSSSTNNMLDTLYRHDASATFFMLGNKLENYINDTVLSPTLEKLLKNGNEVGNHMYNQDASFQLTRNLFNKQFFKTHGYIERLKLWRNNKYKWFRPGSFFPTNQMYDIVGKLGYTLVMGNTHSFDFQIRKTQYNLFALTGRIKSGDIIICHDLKDNLDYVEEMLIYLEMKGFKVITLSKMMETCVPNNKLHFQGDFALH